MSKPNGKARLCLELVRLNQALIRPVHRGPTLNDIFPKLINVKYLSLIDVSSGYHNLNDILYAACFLILNTYSMV